MNDRLDPARLDELWDFGDPDASAQRFADEISTSSITAAAELRTQQARALGLAGRGAEADALLDSLDTTEPLVAIRVALERGRRLNSDGHPESAVPYFEEALRLAGDRDDFLAVDAVHMLAIADTERSADWAARGIRMVAASTDARTKRWAIALHNNLGWKQFDAEHYPEALAEFELSLTAADAHGTAQQQGWAREAIAQTGSRLRSIAGE